MIEQYAVGIQQLTWLDIIVLAAFVLACCITAILVVRTNRTGRASAVESLVVTPTLTSDELMAAYTLGVADSDLRADPDPARGGDGAEN